MRVLLDTGILLRLAHTNHPLSPTVRASVDRLLAQGHTFVCGVQNVAEFWNVTTRPLTARGGFGLSPNVAEQRLATIEQFVAVVPESAASYTEWRRLALAYAISGVQVHAARLVSIMVVEQVSALLTLNPRDFARFAWLTVLTPDAVLAAP